MGGNRNLPLLGLQVFFNIIVKISQYMLTDCPSQRYIEAKMKEVEIRLDHLELKALDFDGTN